MRRLIRQTAAHLTRLGRAGLGRVCRYRFGRALFGASARDEVSVQLLGPDTLGYWEDYLHVPRGAIRFPSPGTYSALAIARGRVVGHVSVFRQWERPDVEVPGWWLTGLEVAPSWRGRATGRRLVCCVLDAWRASETSQDLYLVVHRRNSPAVRLFESVGFHVFRNEDWERRLARVYSPHRTGSWAYQIMAWARE